MKNLQLTHAEALRRLKRIRELLAQHDKLQPSIKEKYTGWIEPDITLEDAAELRHLLNLPEPE